MPTYEYECTECGTVFELVQPITEPARRRLRKGDPKPCACDAPVARRIGTGGGIIFKGSGFYQTDYRSESYKKAAKAESDGKSTKDEAGKKEGGAKTEAAKPKEAPKKEPKPGGDTT
jgi:putative FmdB family regulatory protein